MACPRAENQAILIGNTKIIHLEATAAHSLLIAL